MTETTPPRPFDEHAALAELEQLAERIQSSRRQRERAVADFDAFVKTFHDDQHATRVKAVEAMEQETATARAASAAVPVRSEPERRTPILPPPSQRVDPPAIDRADDGSENYAPATKTDEELGELEPAVVGATSMPAARKQMPFAGLSPATLGLAAAGLLALILIVMWFRSDAPPPASQGTAPAPSSSAAPVAPSPAAAPASSEPRPVASTGPARAVNVELVTLRPVWTRVVVDDRKVIERELPGGERIPLGADRTVIIRAGDAGAVRVTLNGQDQGLLGRDGFPATKTFK